MSLELSAVIQNVCPMAVYRLVCSMGRNGLVKLLTRCHLSLPQYFIADEKHTHCLDKRVYLPTIGCGRVIWHLGYTTAKSVVAFAADYGEFKRVALAPLTRLIRQKGYLRMDSTVPERVLGNYSLIFRVMKIKFREFITNP